MTVTFNKMKKQLAIMLEKLNIDTMLPRLRKIFGYQKPKVTSEGRFIPYLNKEGWERCPNCGDANSLSTRERMYKRCNTCMNVYKDYGVLGWELVVQQEVREEQKEGELV